LQALDQLPNAARNKRDVGPVILHDWLVPANWRDSRIVASIVEFNEALAALQAIEAIDQRRAFVITKLAPLIAFHNKNFRDWETDNPAPGKFANDNTSVSCRVDCLWTQQREAVEAACGWTYEECWKILNDAADEEEE
jgi:hypothetical protein